VRHARGLAAAFGVFGLWWGCWAACLPAVRRATDASTARLGLALLAVSLVALPTMILVGRVADRLAGRLVAPTLVAFAVAGALPAFAHDVPTLALLLAFVGAATGSLDVAVNAAAADLESRRGVRVMDGLHAFFSVGVLCGGVAGGLARHAGASPREILAGAAVAAAVAAFANRRGERPHQPAAQSGPSLVRQLVGVGVILGIAFVVESGLEQWSSVYLEDSLGSGPAVSGLGPGLFAASMATGRMLAQRTSRGTAAARIAFAGIASAAGIAISVATRQPGIALLGLVTAGAGLALSAPTLFGEAGRIAGAGRRGAGISTVAVLSYTGFLVGPPLFGAVAGATSLRGGFVLLCGTAVLLALASGRLRGRPENDA
jgi:MFS family permease